MVSFQYNKIQPDGKTAVQHVKVPLLSLVPIPSIEIQEADLEFYIKISDFQSSKAPTSLQASSDKSEKGDGNWLSSECMEFKTSMGQMKTNSNSQTQMDFQMKVKMKIRQADIPAGLSRLFRLMEEGISSRQSIAKEDA